MGINEKINERKSRMLWLIKEIMYKKKKEKIKKKEIMYIMKYAFLNMKWRLIRHNTVQFSKTVRDTIMLNWNKN